MRTEDILSVADMYVTCGVPLGGLQIKKNSEIKRQQHVTIKTTDIKSIKRQQKQSWAVFH
jgi:hypothetical protein